MQLSKELAVSYRYMLHRLRVGCGNSLEALKGEVEMDACYLGRKEAGSTRTNNPRRAPVASRPSWGCVSDRAGSGLSLSILKTRKLFTAIYKFNPPPFTLMTIEGIKVSGGSSCKTVNHSAKEFVNGMAHTNGLNRYGQF